MHEVLLKKSPIFEDLNKREIKKVASICDTLELRAGEFVFREGDEGDRLFVVEEGAVRISRDVPGTGEEAILMLEQGGCFGEMAVLDRSVRSTDAIVDRRCKLLTIKRPDFVRLLRDDRKIAYKVLWSVVRLQSKRLRATNDSLRSVMVMAMF